MPVDDILAQTTEVGPEGYHAHDRRPGSQPAQQRQQARVDERTVPTEPSPVHDPRAHYDALKARTQLDRETTKFVGSLLSIISAVVNLL